MLPPALILILVFIVAWLILVVIRFRHANAVLIGGLVIAGAAAFVAMALGWMTREQVGFGTAGLSWAKLGFTLIWLVLMIAFSPIADRLAGRWYPRPPTLDAFRPLQQSALMLIPGILVAWLLGGILEELVFRGIVLRSVESLLANALPETFAAAIAIFLAAVGAGTIHLYQGPRGALIILQLSILFGIFFVVTGYDLWAVILCHGLYDSIAFYRFANRQSRYAR